MAWNKSGGGVCRPRFARLPSKAAQHARTALVAALVAVPAAAVAGNPELPYSYERLNEPAAEASVALATDVSARAEVLALVNPDSGARAARLEVLRFDDGARIVVGWQGLAREPILRPEIDPAEERDLVRALNDNLPEGALVLALPERSRRLARLTRLRLPLAQAPLDDTLRLPQIWADRADAILRAEALADGLGITPEGTRNWQRLRAALAAPVDAGNGALAALVGDGPAYLVVHVADPFHLGIGTGERLAMVLRDLPATDVHAAARQVKLWQREGGHAAYTVQSLGARGLRAYFLTSPADRDLLLTRLLPFLPARLTPPQGFRLVWQSGGYRVWKFTP